MGNGAAGHHAVTRARLLGPFAISFGGREAGPWPRPSAKRGTAELVLASPGHRVTRDFACEALFPGRPPADAARALVKALSMARGALATLGGPVAGLLGTDRANLWLAPGLALEVDAEHHESELRAALAMAPGKPATTGWWLPWLTTALSWWTSPTPTGPGRRGSAWKPCANRPDSPWPETGPKGRAVAARRP